MMPAQMCGLLESLTRDVVSEHEACLASAADAVTHAINAGRKLIEIKESLPHGQFMTHVERNCPFSYQTASRYMLLGKSLTRERFDSDHPKSINAALKMLADDSDSDHDPDPGMGLLRMDSQATRQGVSVVGQPTTKHSRSGLGCCR